MKTNELTGHALDWAVAKCENKPIQKFYSAWGWWETTHDFDTGRFKFYCPSTNWAQGGPIIEREKINLRLPRKGSSSIPTAHIDDEVGFKAIETGPTPLIAAMRCYVAGKLGDDIDIPKELTCHE